MYSEPRWRGTVRPSRFWGLSRSEVPCLLVWFCLCSPSDLPATTARSGATAKPKEEAPKTREQAKKPKEPPAKEENRNVPGVLDTFVLSQGLRARAIGPAIMGGRVAALALDPMNPYTFYVWLGTGGGMKTTDNGQRFTALFQKQPVAAIGAISVAPVCAVGREYGHAQVCRYQAEGETSS
jgi:hypothetical protein